MGLPCGDCCFDWLPKSKLVAIFPETPVPLLGSKGKIVWQLTSRNGYWTVQSGPLKSPPLL